MQRNRRLRVVLKALIPYVLVCPPMQLSAVSQTASAPQPVRIERIIFSGNRTDEKLLRRHIPFSEGDILEPDSLTEAKTGLWDMRQFKRVEVSSSAVTGGKAEIIIRVEDGWYLVPLPVFSGGSGGGRAGLMLFGRNIFRHAESVFASAFKSSAGSAAALFLQRERSSLAAYVRRRDFTERRYADGAFSSSSGSGRPPDESDPSKYGVVSDSYRKVQNMASLAAGLPLARASGILPGLSASLGWERFRLNYTDPSPDTPGDAGHQDQAFVALKTDREGAGLAEGMGAIFRYGLADMERRLAPLPSHKLTSGAEISWHTGSAWTGSDISYGYILARWEGTLTWGTHRSLSLRLAGGRGGDLPPGRLLATGQATGFAGNYAREFRGESAAGAGLLYSHPFRITRRGIWQGALFVETARAWGGAESSGAKAGAGASFWYKFWRFPLPLGFSYTYSFDDRNPQASVAMGGRF